MTENYEVFCLTDRFFYEKPSKPTTENPDFALCERPVPELWDHEPSDTWMFYVPQQGTLPSQGWKIHVSSCLADAERVLDVVWDYCVPRGIAFKFLRSKTVMVMFNSKSAFRGSSGKLLTIYPSDQDHFERALTELAELLDGVAGPYILSDLRYGDGPLFVRYGGFAERFCIADNGERVLAIENADGKLVADVRGPIFALPPWVPLPEFLEPHLAARKSVTLAGLPYEVESAMQFSNGGGVYLGRDTRTQERIVLKEGRPHAGLDVNGRDAVTRIRHERDILLRLAGLDAVPAVHDDFVLGDHHFLVEEFVDGNPLQRLLVHRYPLTHPDCSAQALADYVDWALGMLDQVTAAMKAVHERGVVFGDLHPDNILVTEAGRLVLIDYEVATLAEDRARSALAHPAFAAPADRVGVEVDEYALACMYLGMFAPQTTIMVAFDPGKARQVAEFITEVFPVSPAAIESAVRIIEGTREGREPGVMGSLPMPGVASWPDVRASMSAAILASATPERDDRLFPGDVAQFGPGGGISIANGAAGVLHALAATGAGRFPEHEDWLRKHALSPADNVPPGFYNGLHGVAYVLAELGHRQDALDIVAHCLRTPQESSELGLHSGLAGIGLNLLHFGALTSDSTFVEQAGKVVDLLADRLGGPDDVPELSGGDNPRAGLMYGSSGIALLFLQAYEHSGDPNLLDKAEIALRQDLRRCMRAEDGTVQVDQGWRSLPYLDEGSVGIALVLARYLTHRGDDDLADMLSRLQAMTRSGYFVQSGLHAGRAGMIACAAMTEGTADPALIRGLSWHAVPYGGGLAFPGDQLLRLSMDFATGTAGVLFALGTALHDEPVSLPFLASPKNADTKRYLSGKSNGSRCRHHGTSRPAGS